ncbi:zinc ribbon domain-containing protein [Streptomyces sp. NPDC023838]|uniref:NADase-type glycan-binding domain-containing protein n=1 Tax=Streptomyces sp. NPDC023838 TaxID=3154325 RepID=UPI0033EF069D
MTTHHCAECGTRAEPGQSFCDSCGAVLGWDRAGARAPRSAATADSAAARDTLDRPGPRAGSPVPAADRNNTGTATDATTDGRDRPVAVDHTPHAPQQPLPADPDTTPDRVPAPTSTPDQGADGPPRASAGYDAGDSAPTVPVAPVPPSGTDDAPDSDRARSLLVPVADPAAPSAAPPPAVAPVLPGRPDADRPQVRAPGLSQETGGPPCPWCATPNRVDRHFCVRCAMPLADEAVQPPGHRPWWRRLLGRDRDTPWAGDRPPLRRAFDRIGTWVAAALALTLLVLGILYIPDAVQAGRDHFAKRAPVAPDGVRASRSYPGHAPALTIDKRSNTWWGPGVSQSGQGEWIEFSFAEPTRLLDVIITPGVSARAEQLGASALPYRVKATVTMKDGKTTTRDITLDQGAGGQRRPFRIADAVRVRLTVESAYAVSGDKQVAIAEVEFFGRSSSNSI